MLIIQDGTGVTIKQRIQDENFVRIGVIQTALWIDGVPLDIRRNAKPHGEFDINDCAELLGELEYRERMI